jgi:hypothetical protein
MLLSCNYVPAPFGRCADPIARREYEVWLMAIEGNNHIPGSGLAWSIRYVTSRWSKIPLNKN